MKLPANVSLLAIVAAITLLGLTAVFGAGLVSGMGIWSSFGSFNPFGERETIIHDERPAVLHQIQSLSRLETSKYVLEKIIEAEKSGDFLRRDFLFGDRLFLIAHGYVTAGVDLSELQDSDVNVVNESSVWIMLPPSEIFVSTLDNEQTQVYDRNRGWLTRGDIHLESEARREAEQLIHQAACDADILEQAAADAEIQMTAFLGLLGFEEITVVAPAGECAVGDDDSL